MPGVPAVAKRPPAEQRGERDGHGRAEQADYPRPSADDGNDSADTVFVARLYGHGHVAYGRRAQAEGGDGFQHVGRRVEDAEQSDAHRANPHGHKFIEHDGAQVAYHLYASEQFHRAENRF